MFDLHTFLFSILLAGLVLIGLRTGMLWAMRRHPLISLLIAMSIGTVYRLLGGPLPDLDAVRGISRFLLGVLAFFAAQQCRVSRLPRISPEVYRFATLGIPLNCAVFAATGYLVVPGLDLGGLMIVSGALVLGGALAIDRPLLNAPIEEHTRRAARLESAAVLAVALPIALVLEAGATVPEIALPLDQTPLFEALAGFAVGGTAGLLAGRLLKLSDVPVPVLPFLVAGAVFAITTAIGFDGTMALAAAGLLYSEEAPLRGTVRTRVWRLAEAMIAPVAIAGFGLILGPLIFGADLLIWVAAAVSLFAARVASRFALLQTLELPAPDRTFLSWFGGAPGIATILALLSLTASPAPLLEESALTYGAVCVIVGLFSARLSSRLLTQRLVHATAAERKRHRFGTA